MSLWTWTVRDRHVVGVSEAPDVGISTLVTLDWGPASFPWGEARFPSLHLLSILVGGGGSARPFSPAVTISLPGGSGLERDLTGPRVASTPAAVGSRAAWFLDVGVSAVTLPAGLEFLSLSGQTLPYGTRLLYDPVSGINSVLSVEGANPFTPTFMDGVIVTGILE